MRLIVERGFVVGWFDGKKVLVAVCCCLFVGVFFVTSFFWGGIRMKR